MGHVVASIFFYFLIAFIGLIVVIAAEDARPWYENLPAVAMGEYKQHKYTEFCKNVPRSQKKPEQAN